MKIVLDGKSTWVNYHHLYCFYTIAKQGTLILASQELGIGQSALSIQMKQFEDSLGFTLFERSHKKLIPNERGRIVLSYAKEIFRLGSEMIETLHDRPSADRVHLKIGALDTIPKHLSVQMVEAAVNQKNSSVSVIEGKLEELVQKLLQHQIDLVVTNYLPITEPGLVFSKSIAKLPLWIVGSKAFLKLKRNFPQSLNGQPFVLPTGDSQVRHEFENFSKKNNFSPDVVAEAQDVMVQKLLSVHGIGMTVVPEFAAREHLKKKELFLISQLDNKCEELFLLSASRKIDNPIASYLMNHFNAK